jgi:hypothetical protein
VTGVQTCALPISIAYDGLASGCGRASDGRGGEEDQEDEDQEEEDDEDQDEDQEDDEPKVTMEQLATKLQNMGYTAIDFLTFVMGASLKRQDEARQTDEFLSELSNKIDDIVDGKITLAHRDQRSYAQVAKSQQTPIQPPTQIQEA